MDFVKIAWERQIRKTARQNLNFRQSVTNFLQISNFRFLMSSKLVAKKQKDGGLGNMPFFPATCFLILQFTAKIRGLCKSLVSFRFEIIS